MKLLSGDAFTIGNPDYECRRWNQSMCYRLKRNRAASDLNKRPGQRCHGRKRKKIETIWRHSNDAFSETMWDSGEWMSANIISQFAAATAARSHARARVCVNARGSGEFPVDGNLWDYTVKMRGGKRNKTVVNGQKWMSSRVNRWGQHRRPLQIDLAGAGGLTLTFPVL